MKSSEKKGSSSESKGITLIALIVTIIVLLILAGVTLNMVLDKNGLINKAQSAVSAQNVAAIKEALELEKTELYLAKGSLNIDDFIEQITTGNKSFTVDSIDKISDTELEIVINGDNKFIIKDNGKGDLDVEYKGVAQVGDLTLSATSGTYTYPNNGTFTVTNNKSGGALSAESESPDIATVSVNGNTITVYPGTTAGKARIIVKSAAVGEYAENRAIYMATVEGIITISATPYTGTYDGAEHDALTNVSTEPNDATLEYLLDGVSYGSTIPTVKNASSFTVKVSASKEGYKTQTETYTVTVNKAAGGLNLSATSGTIMYPNSTSITASGNTGTISVSSSNTNVATVSVNGNTITVTPKNVNGTATITVTSAATTNYNAKSATYTVTVKKKYSVGESVTVGGKAFYVIGDDGTNVTLLCKTTIGTATWANAKSQASTFGSNLGGSGRLMNKTEVQGVAASYMNLKTDYWLEDYYGNSSTGNSYAWYVAYNQFTHESRLNYQPVGNTKSVRPVVVISKSKL